VNIWESKDQRGHNFFSTCVSIPPMRINFQSCFLLSNLIDTVVSSTGKLQFPLDDEDNYPVEPAVARKVPSLKDSSVRDVKIHSSSRDKVVSPVAVSEFPHPVHDSSLKRRANEENLRRFQLFLPRLQETKETNEGVLTTITNFVVQNFSGKDDKLDLALLRAIEVSEDVPNRPRFDSETEAKRHLKRGFESAFERYRKALLSQRDGNELQRAEHMRDAEKILEILNSNPWGYGLEF
jgi:hypothetical protein